VKFGPDTKYVPVRMYGSPRYKLQEIPDVSQPEHNHVFGNVKRAPARVMVFVKRNVEKLKERFRVSEHPFGTIKFYDGAHYFLCRGKEKVAAETSLMFTSYDIRRAITLCGAPDDGSNPQKKEPGDTHAHLTENAGGNPAFFGHNGRVSCKNDRIAFMARSFLQYFKKNPPLSRRIVVRPSRNA